MKSDRVKHDSHPNGGPSHPFKALTLCGKMVRFGGFGEPTTCKKCLQIQAKLCPKCKGTGVVSEQLSTPEQGGEF